MKKIFLSTISLSLVLLFATSISVKAQNIGSLKNVVTPGFSFTLDLSPGDTDFQVLQLQKVLNADIDTTVALDGEGSVGKESKYFGEKTKMAVIKFQEKYRDTILTPNGLTKGTGFVGKATRTKLNLLIGVMSTTNSVGRPESVSNTTPTTNTTPSVTPTNQTNYTVTNNTPQSQMSICSFIELLINIQAISPSLAPKARSIFGCGTTVATNLVPSVNITANGIDGLLIIDSARDVNISWISSNVTSCRSSSGPRPLSGSTKVNISKTGTVNISCTGPYGTVTDSVEVRLSEDNNFNNSIPSVSCFSSLDSVPVGNTTVWVAQASGGVGSYTYSWSGDALSTSNNSYLPKTYSTTGTKTAIVKVTSGGVSSATSSCSVVVSTSTAGISTSTSPISVTCRSFPSTVTVGNIVNWFAMPSTYNNNVYSWTLFDDSFSSTSTPDSANSYISKTYSTVGTKTAIVKVTSNGTSSATSSCSVVVNTTPNYDDLFASTTATTTLDFGYSTTSMDDLSDWGLSSTTSDLSTSTPAATSTVATTTPNGDDEDTTEFGGQINATYKCKKPKDTYEVKIEGPEILTGYIVYYNEDKLATSSKDAGDIGSLIPGRPILGEAYNDGGPDEDECGNSWYYGNIAGNYLYYKRLGYIKEFGI